MIKSITRRRWFQMFALMGVVMRVSCVQAVFREAQFGAFDGVNGFVAGSVEAILVSIVPFISPA